jgi:hypothetical protein
VLRAYVDDSGRGQGAAFVLSGYLAKPTVWESFANEWSVELNAEPAIQYFKMKEAASRTGQFNGHERQSIDLRLSNLVAILESHDIKGVTVGVDRDAFSEIVLPHVARLSIPAGGRKMMSNPYFLCFYQLIVLVMYAQQNLGELAPVDFVFDEQGKEGRRVREYWHALRRLVPEDAVKAMMVEEPVFHDDKTMPPLQAADLSAWQYRRFLQAMADRPTEFVQPNAIMARLGNIPHLEYMMSRKILQEFMNNYHLLDFDEAGW